MLLAVIVCLVLDRQGKEYAVLVSLCVCTGVLILAAVFLEPVFSFLKQIVELGKLDDDLVEILFKVLGICLLSEISGLICADAGRASLGKALNMLANAVILWISIPIFQALLGLIQEILGEV